MSVATRPGDERPRQHRPTEAQIDLEALTHNALALRALITRIAREAGQASPPATLAVVKADA